MIGVFLSHILLHKEKLITFTYWDRMCESGAFQPVIQIFCTKGAMTIFGVMRKTIAHSIQNCLLYLLVIIARSDNYQNLSYKQISKAIQNGKITYVNLMSVRLMCPYWWSWYTCTRICVRADDLHWKYDTCACAEHVH